MPLLELIATPKTAPEVIATTVELGRKQGKTVIVVQDGAGFYVNRILAPYLNEAGYLLAEGAAVDAIDQRAGAIRLPGRAVRAAGRSRHRRRFQGGADPARSLRRADETGPGDAASCWPMAATAARARRAFTSTKASRRARSRWTNTVYGILGVSGDKTVDAKEIVERCVLMMLNEAALCWDEGMIRSLRDGDIGAVFGIGFPPFLGGPFRWVDAEGAGRVLERMRRLEGRFGALLPSRAPPDSSRRPPAGPSTCRTRAYPVSETPAPPRGGTGPTRPASSSNLGPVLQSISAQSFPASRVPRSGDPRTGRSRERPAADAI